MHQKPENGVSSPLLSHPPSSAHPGLLAWTRNSELGELSLSSSSSSGFIGEKLRSRALRSSETEPRVEPRKPGCLLCAAEQKLLTGIQERLGGPDWRNVRPKVCVCVCFCGAGGRLRRKLGWNRIWWRWGAWLQGWMDGWMGGRDAGHIRGNFL